MSGTLARRVPTNGTADTRGPRLRLGTCRAFVAPVPDGAQDQAIAQQDPDIALAAPAARLSAMPASLPTAALRWLRAVARTLAERFRRPTYPSTSSPATGRPVSRAVFAGKALGSREFTTPRAFAHAERSRLRVKSAGFSTRIASLPSRSKP